jgi:ABC-type transport system involved in multi-copper enzyme maturation permease subunit
MTTLPALRALATATVAEAIRDRILYGLLLFALGMILLSAVLSTLTMGHPVRIVTNLCFTAISVAGALMAILLGVGAVAREVERRTAYPVLAKPVSRAGYVVGKYVGVLATVYLNVLVMMAATTVMIVAYQHVSPFQYPIDDYLLTLGLALVRLALIGAIAVAFSTFTSSTVALIASVGITVAGHLTAELRAMLGRSEDPLTRAMADGLFFVVPDFAAMEALPRLLHGEPILAGGAGLAAAYGLLYAAAVLALAVAAFTRRDMP